MKQILNRIFAVVFSLGFLVPGLTLRAWADSAPTPSSTSAATPQTVAVPDNGLSAELTTDEPTPVPVHHHRRKKIQPALDATPSPTDAASNTLNATTSPTPAATLQAQATTVPDYQLNAVVVTSTKTKLKVLDAPAQVEVLTQSDIQNKDVDYFDDALSTVSGVEVSRVAEGGQSVTVIERGIPGYDNTLVLVDGFPFNQAYNERVFWNRIPSPLVDHVEAVEGPFSSLYGKDAVGGVINIITKEPVGEEFDFSENWDSTNLRTTDIDYQKRIDKNFAVFFGVENTDVSGYTDYQYIQATPVAASVAATIHVGNTVNGATQTTTTTGTTIYNIGLSAPTVLENDNLSAKFYWTPDENNELSLLFNFSYWDQPTADQEGEIGSSYLTDATTHNAVYTGAVSVAGTGNILSLTESQFLTTPGQNSFAAAYLQYKLNLNKDLNFTANFDYTDGPHLQSENALPLATTTTFGGPVTGQILGTWFGNWQGFGDGQFDWKLDNHEVIAGLSLEEVTTDLYTVDYPNWTNINVGAQVPNSDTGLVETIAGVYAQDQWKLFSPFTLVLGARVDYWDPTNIQIYNPSTATSSSYTQNTFTSFNPKASLVFKIDEHGSLRASIGTAFNPPAPFELTNISSTATSASIPNPALLPEEDLGSEVGGEYELPTGTTVSTTFFDNYFTNLIYAQSTKVGNFTTTEYENAGVADIQGFDAEIRQKVFPFLKVYGNTTIVAAQFLQDNVLPSAVGQQVPFVSPVVYNVGADINADRWAISIWDTYHAAEYQTANNVDTVKGVQGSYDSYSTLNLKIRYKVNDLTLSLGADNLLNVQYYTDYLNPGIILNFGGRLNLI
jgi:iron complex outermembrane receptor protein